MQDQHVIVMFEPAQPDEKLRLTEQVNEVFGPFEDGDVAQKWLDDQLADRFKNVDRLWLIIPLSDPYNYYL